MKRPDRQNYWACISRHPLALIIGSGAVTWFALLAAGPARSDWWPNTRVPAPFSLEIRVTAYDRNQVGSLAEVMKEAQRSDGTSAIVDTLYFPHVRPRTIRVVRLPDGTRIRLVDAVSAKSTCRPKHPEEAPVRQTLFSAPKPPNCLGPSDKLLGQTVLFGQKVAIVKTWDRGSAGRKWLAPGLGCKELQWQQASLQLDGSRRIELEGKLVSFTLSEPDARLFDLGASYAEVKPSELLRREVKAGGDLWSSQLAEEGEREDFRYAAACSAK